MEKKTIEKNLSLYNEGRSVPEEAKKALDTGRFKGTYVNPMWRINTLTSMFGSAGIGWFTEVKERYTEQNTDGSVAAFVDINLYLKVDGEWSKPIFGTGGSELVSIEKKYSRDAEPFTSLFLSDEAYKMSYTDALSVACKALGIADDDNYEKEKTKYTADETVLDSVSAAASIPSASAPSRKTLKPGKPGWKETIAWLSDLRKAPQTVKANYNFTEEDFNALCKAAGRQS